MVHKLHPHCGRPNPRTGDENLPQYRALHGGRLHLSMSITYFKNWPTLHRNSQLVTCYRLLEYIMILIILTKGLHCNLPLDGSWLCPCLHTMWCCWGKPSGYSHKSHKSRNSLLTSLTITASIMAYNKVCKAQVNHSRPSILDSSLKHWLRISQWEHIPKIGYPSLSHQNCSSNLLHRFFFSQVFFSHRLPRGRPGRTRWGLRLPLWGRLCLRTQCWKLWLSRFLSW